MAPNGATGEEDVHTVAKPFQLHGWCLCRDIAKYARLDVGRLPPVCAGVVSGSRWAVGTAVRTVEHPQTGSSHLPLRRSVINPTHSPGASKRHWLRSSSAAFTTDATSPVTHPHSARLANNEPLHIDVTSPICSIPNGSSLRPINRWRYTHHPQLTTARGVHLHTSSMERVNTLLHRTSFIRHTTYTPKSCLVIDPLLIRI